VSDTPREDGPTLTPLAIVKPDKPISEMTDAELDALGDRLFDGIAAARHPV
jgi:hypothetical protein